MTQQTDPPPHALVYRVGDDPLNAFQRVSIFVLRVASHRLRTPSVNPRHPSPSTPARHAYARPTPGWCGKCKRSNFIRSYGVGG